MNNYEYIIASLPQAESLRDTGTDFGEILAGIREQLSERDKGTLDFFLKGYSEEFMTREFYSEALSSKDRFIREYFRFDLCLRNAKVEYLNRELERPEGTDIMDINCGEVDGIAEIKSVLGESDLLQRERSLDDLMWEKTWELTALETFSIDAILSFVARMKTVERWMKLDERQGRELFRKFVKEIKETYSI